jgi:hypothetical protein
VYVFIEWLNENWDLIIDIFMWGMSLLMVFVLTAKIYKIIKLKFEAVDAVGLFFGAAWILAIIFFGFDHVRTYLQSFL